MRVQKSHYLETAGARTTSGKGNKAREVRKEQIRRSLENRQPHVDLVENEDPGRVSQHGCEVMKTVIKEEMRQEAWQGGAEIGEEAVIQARGGDDTESPRQRASLRRKESRSPHQLPSARPKVTFLPT